MDTPAPDAHRTPIPNGWRLVDRFDGPTVTLLEFQRGGRMGPRVSAVGKTFDEALAYGLDRMLLNDERDRQRGVL